MAAATPKNDLHSYQIRFCGQVDDDFIASYCPAGSMVEQQGELIILTNIQTDQSGIIGLIRHLHNLGCTILAMNC